MRVFLQQVLTRRIIAMSHHCCKVRSDTEQPNMRFQRRRRRGTNEDNTSTATAAVVVDARHCRARR